MDPIALFRYSRCGGGGHAEELAASREVLAHAEELAASLKVLAAVTVGEQAIVSDTDEALGQDV
jgi:hypothetical protein